jgi:hypothetical protein
LFIQDDDDEFLSLIDEDENDSVLEDPPTSSTSKPTSKPTSTPIAPQSIGKRRKPRDAVSEQILNYLDKKSKSSAEKSDEESFALSIIPSLKRLTDQQKALAKLRIQQTLYEIEYGTGSHSS